jgi:hypothetical protein
MPREQQQPAVFEADMLLHFALQRKSLRFWEKCREGA